MSDPVISTDDTVTTAIEDTIDSLFGTAEPEPEAVEPESETTAPETTAEATESAEATETGVEAEPADGFLKEPTESKDEEDLERTWVGDTLMCCHKLWKKGFLDIDIGNRENTECLEKLTKYEEWLAQSLAAVEKQSDKKQELVEKIFATGYEFVRDDTDAVLEWLAWSDVDGQQCQEANILIACPEPEIDQNLKDLFTGSDEQFEQAEALLEALNLIFQFRLDSKNETNPAFNQDWQDELPSLRQCSSSERLIGDRIVENIEVNVDDTQTIVQIMPFLTRIEGLATGQFVPIGLEAPSSRI